MSTANGPSVVAPTLPQLPVGAMPAAVVAAIAAKATIPNATILPQRVHNGESTTRRATGAATDRGTSNHDEYVYDEDAMPAWYVPELGKQIIRTVDPGQRIPSPLPSYHACLHMSREKARGLCKLLVYVYTSSRNEEKHKCISTNGTKRELARRQATFFYHLAKQRRRSSDQLQPSEASMNTTVDDWHENEDIRLLEVVVAEKNRATVKSLYHRDSATAGSILNNDIWGLLAGDYNDFSGFQPGERLLNDVVLNTMDPNDLSIVRRRDQDSLKSRWGLLRSTLAVVMSHYLRGNNSSRSPRHFYASAAKCANDLRNVMFWMFKVLVVPKHELYEGTLETFPESMRTRLASHERATRVATADRAVDARTQVATTARGLPAGRNRGDEPGHFEPLLLQKTQTRVALLEQKRKCEDRVLDLESRLEVATSELQIKRLKRARKTENRAFKFILRDLKGLGWDLNEADGDDEDSEDEGASIEE